MILVILQTVVAVLLIISILLQSQGTGLSTAFGGGGEFYRSKRSIERMMIFVTVFLSAIFVVLSLLLLVAR